MTDRQERMVNRIKREAEECFDSYEIKNFEVEENEFFVSVLIEIGTPGDEGTLAEAFCRYRVLVFIGKRGGTRIPCHKFLKNGEIKCFYRKYTEFFSSALAYMGK